jgi:hypothetical protein
MASGVVFRLQPKVTESFGCCSPRNRATNIELATIFRLPLLVLRLPRPNCLPLTQPIDHVIFEASRESSPAQASEKTLGYFVCEGISLYAALKEEY